jgi:hypothetical protein
LDSRSQIPDTEPLGKPVGISYVVFVSARLAALYNRQIVDLAREDLVKPLTLASLFDAQMAPAGDGFRELEQLFLLGFEDHFPLDLPLFVDHNKRTALAVAVQADILVHGVPPFVAVEVTGFCSWKNPVCSIARENSIFLSLLGHLYNVGARLTSHRNPGKGVTRLNSTSAESSRRDALLL